MFIKRWLRDRWDEFDYGTRTRLTAAALVPGSIYSRAMRGRVLVRNEILEKFKTYDGLISLMNFVPHPWATAKRLWNDRDFRRLWLSDIRYYRACSLFSCRVAPNYKRLARFVKPGHEISTPAANHSSQTSLEKKWEVSGRRGTQLPVVLEPLCKKATT